MSEPDADLPPLTLPEAVAVYGSVEDEPPVAVEEADPADVAEPPEDWAADAHSEAYDADPATVITED